jgi:hypothetical protein
MKNSVHKPDGGGLVGILLRQSDPDFPNSLNFKRKLWVTPKEIDPWDILQE